MTLEDLTAKIFKKRRRRRNWKKIVSGFAMVVVFCTTYALILPAITLENNPICGLEGHAHTENCYADITEDDGSEKRVLVCGLEEHVHTNTCYKTDAEDTAEDLKDDTGKSDDTERSDGTRQNVDAEQSENMSQPDGESQSGVVKTTDDANQPADGALSDVAGKSEDTELADDMSQLDDADEIGGEGDATEVLIGEEQIANVFYAVLQVSSVADNVSALEEKTNNDAVATGDNAWQIDTVESYNSLNGARMTKTIEGTDTEDIFKVTVTIEREPELEELQQVLQASGGLALQSESSAGDPGQIVDYSRQSKDTPLLGADQNSGSVLVTYKTSKGNFKVTMYADTNANQGQYHGVLASLPNGKWISVSHDKFKFRSGNTVELSDVVDLTKYEDELFEAIAPSFDKVTDEIDTSRFTYLGISSDGSGIEDINLMPTLGTASHDGNGTITWTNLNELKADTKETMYYYVRLKTSTIDTSTADAAETAISAMNYSGNGAVGGASYAEGTATAMVSVKTTDVTTGITTSDTEIFTVTRPSVKGLLYYIQLEKADAENLSKKLSNAVFNVFDGEDVSKDPVATITTNSDGIGLSTPGLPWGTYTVVEAAAPEGYKMPDDPTVGTYRLGYAETIKNTEGWQSQVVDSNKPGVNLTGDDAVINEELLCNIILKKVSMSDISMALEGAEFTLYDVDETVLYEGLQSDATGVFTPASPQGLFMLDEGSYYLEETKAPDGYDRLNDRVEIDVAGTGITAHLQNSTTMYNVEKENIGGVDTYTIFITNSSGYKLPETGGAGTIWYTLGGLSLMLGTARLLYRRKKH